MLKRTPATQGTPQPSFFKLLRIISGGKEQRVITKFYGDTGLITAFPDKTAKS
jgi:hypothetical protein